MAYFHNTDLRIKNTFYHFTVKSSPYAFSILIKSLNHFFIFCFFLFFRIFLLHGFGPACIKLTQIVILQFSFFPLILKTSFFKLFFFEFCFFFLLCTELQNSVSRIRQEYLKNMIKNMMIYFSYLICASMLVWIEKFITIFR